VSFQVRLKREAEEDLVQRFDFLPEPELSRDGSDLMLAERALGAIRWGLVTLNTSPFMCRKAWQSPFLRELITPFGRTGYVALFEAESATEVAVVAVRHRLGDDYQ
jgi:hypothetical protein